MSMFPLTVGAVRALFEFDASSYMLVEASGDSESEYYDAGVSAAEDDAESCSCAFLSDTAPEINDGAGGDDFLEDDDSGCGCGAAEVEDGVVDQCRGAAAELKNSQDSDMSEKETDRLFWEACLAS